MKNKLLFLMGFLFVFQVLVAQVQKVETYLTGTKVTYYPDQCGNTIPEAEGKISFCDSQNNLGVVEASYGLSARAIKKMVPNYYNDDEVFITDAGISIKKTNGTWENIPKIAAPRAYLNGNPPTMSEAVINNDGLLFFVNNNNFGLNYFDLNTKTFSSISYNTGTGGSNINYTHSFAYDAVANIAYVLAQSGGNFVIYKYENDVLSFVASVPASIYIGGFASSFIFAHDALFIGANTGLYKLNKNTIILEASYLTDTSQYIPNIKDIADDGNGNLWVVGQGYYDAAIYKLNVSTENITTFQLANTPTSNYTFNNMDIDINGKVWATANNLNGFAELELDGDNAIWTVTPLSDMAALGFNMTYAPSEVYRFNNKIYLMTTSNPSSSPDENYEAIVNDNGVWSGINDDTPNNLSVKLLNRYHYAYPDDDGVWFYNFYDTGIMSHISNTDEFKKQYNLGGTNSFILDVDGNPVISYQTLRKVYMPYVANFPSHGSSGITSFKRYKDQIWMYSRDVKKIFVYKHNQLIQTISLDEDEYIYWYNFTPDIYGNAFFAKYNNQSNFELKKFDTNTQTTTTYTGDTNLGGISKLLPLPNGNVAVICGTGIFLFDGTSLKSIGYSDFSGLYNIVTGVSDINGKIWLLTNDSAKIVGIENPEAASPTFSSIQVEGSDGIMPYNGFYRPEAFAIDANGAFLSNASVNWARITTDNTAKQFLNEGITYGITGKVYVDLNENNQFDANEGYPNQKITLKTTLGTVYETYTIADGSYYFPYFEGLGTYEITLPVLSPYVVAPERQRIVSVTDLDADTNVTYIQLQPKDIESLLVKSSSKEGAWGFTRANFENTFTTAIGNLSYSKTFNNVSFDYVFFNSAENTNNVLPNIEEVKITRLQPLQPFHIIDQLTIEPRSHKWDANVSPSTYTSTILALTPEITTVSDTTKVSFTLPQISPLDTYILEVKTEAFAGSSNGMVVSYGVSKASSEDFDSLPDNDFFLLIPRNPEDEQGLPDLAGPYKTPEEIYSDPPYIPRKDIYSDGPYYTPIRSSYDPNDKLVNPGVPNALNEIAINDKWLTYTIRFQNEGNFSAKDIFVIDSLDQKFDKYSLTLLESSHPLTIENIKSNDQNIVKFNFKDIYLDYTANDELASQGYLKYMIKAKDDVVLGDIMENRAAIYFDQNPPIITNLTQNKYVEISLNINEFTEEGNVIKFWPNPVDDYINIKTNGNTRFSLKLYNLLGQELQSISTFKQNHQLDVSHLKTGFYVLKVNLENGKMQSVKFVKN